MLNIIKAIIFGIIEGVTEWLPISSTGHLILAKAFMSFTNVSENFWNVFEVIIQLGAILAVIIMYFKNIWPIKVEKNKHSGGSCLKWDKSILRLWAKIIVACLPAVAIAILKIDELADKYFYNPMCIAIMLILVGILFIVIENHNNKEPKIKSVDEITFKESLIIGLFQVIAAIFPGTSRSGITIIGALLIGIARPVAAEFTFYLAIPAMAGASLLKLVKFGFNFTSTELLILIVGVVSAFIVSMIVIKYFMNYIRKHDFKPFGYYRIVLGIIVLLLLATHVI